MQFYDKVAITVRSWKGGDGSTAWRREKYVAYGGPAWWDGGDGGSVIIQADHNEYTLMAYRVNATYKAWNGENWKGKDQYGHSWEDKILIVPVGTVVRNANTWETLASLQFHGDSIIVAQWWRWGLWNKHFVTPQKQRSTIGLLGEPAIQQNLELELQLLADVALIWAPSVGKSSYINAVSNVKAQVAEYHFTTLVPNLGVVTHNDTSFTMIDIPWLIEGASDGKWLGNAFLRHILKSSLLTLTIDCSRYETWVQEAIALLWEREQYLKHQYWEGKSIRKYEKNELIHTYIAQDTTIQKKRYFLFSKSDLLCDQEIRDELSQMLYDQITQIHSIQRTKQEYVSVSCFSSSATHEHVDSFLEYCTYHLEPVESERVQHEQQNNSSIHRSEPDCYQLGKEAYDHLLEEGYINAEESKKIWLWAVEHPDVAYLTYVLPRWNDEAELWYRQRLEELRILPWLREQGVKKWDILMIEWDYHDLDERWVKWE